MSRRRLLRPAVRTMISGALLGAVGTVGAAAAVAVPSAQAGVNHLVAVSGATDNSLNWAGYAVTPGSGITAVSSTFTVPSAGEVPPGFAASWAGIGGFTTSDLIQAGVSENDAVGGALLGGQYNAWYEILPASETPITGGCSGNVPSCTVNPGDKISVNISNAGGNTWNISLSDAGNWSWSTSVNYASSESSAEWIQEAPSLAGAQTIPADVGTVSFGSTSTFTEGGSAHTIAEGSPTLINESPVGTVNEATTSPLASDGQSFNVCVYAQSCAAP
jgi:peptidase A4-like protein